MERWLAPLAVLCLVAGVLLIERQDRRWTPALGLITFAAVLMTTVIVSADTPLWVKGFGVTSQVLLVCVCVRGMMLLRRDQQLIVKNHGLDAVPQEIGDTTELHDRTAFERNVVVGRSPRHRSRYRTVMQHPDRAYLDARPTTNDV